MGVQGVRLKKFEEAVADILAHESCVPNYLPLPSLPNADIRELVSSSIQANPIFKSKIEAETSRHVEDDTPPPEWPFSILPLDAGVRSKAKNDRSRSTGKLPGMKAVKKEWQLKSLIQCVLAMLPSSAFGAANGSEEKKIRIVDFAGGTGHLSLPLAVLLPKCEIVLVDLKGASLELAHLKAEELVNPSKEDLDEDVSSHHLTGKKKKKKRPKPPSESHLNDVTIHANILRQSKHLPNLYTYHGSISTYAKEHNDFDIGLGLHACGEATDIVLRACGQAKANFIVSPCCVGKLSQTKQNTYIYLATAGNEPTISYPQSSVFCQIIPSSGQFDVLAKAADYSEMEDMRTCRNATRRTAKALLEMDRLFYMKETYGYDDIALTRMDPWEASPKNDIIIGWTTRSNGVGCPYKGTEGGVDNIVPCADCNADIKMAVNQLISTGVSHEDGKHTTDKTSSGDHVDWTKDEQDEIEAELQAFLKSSELVYKFPRGMGWRQRKLVHFVAERNNLRHWSEGKKYADKIAVVGKQSSTV